VIIPQLPNLPPAAIVFPIFAQAAPFSRPFPQARLNNSELVYNVTTPLDFNYSQELQAIVDKAVSLAADKRLPIKPLSITLIDIKNGESAGYQQNTLRYPASVVKIFWMVYLYAQIEKGLWNEADLKPYLNKMIHSSDNNAASYIIDLITGTQSGSKLDIKKYETWLNQRWQVNIFFQKAGYEKIDITQKNFPIPDLSFSEPQGRDLQMRGDPKNPIRNKITTQQAARLLSEIYDGQSISQIYSEKMASWLSIDPATRIEKKDDQNPNEFNPVRGYFSESLPTNVNFGGKAGWTSNTRQEAAYIARPDGKAAYILVVFAEDRTYAYDWKIFPQMSRLVYDRMINRK
jgi:beta-lactamase class A